MGTEEKIINSLDDSPILLEVVREPHREASGRKPLARSLPLLVILCSLILLLDLVAPVCVYANRQLFANATELILLGTSALSGFIGVVTGLAIGAYISARDE